MWYCNRIDDSGEEAATAAGGADDDDDDDDDDSSDDSGSGSDIEPDSDNESDTEPTVKRPRVVCNFSKSQALSYRPVLSVCMCVQCMHALWSHSFAINL